MYKLYQFFLSSLNFSLYYLNLRETKFALLLDEELNCWHADYPFITAARTIQLIDIVHKKLEIANITNEQKRKSCKTVIGVECLQMFKECTTYDNNFLYSCEIETADNGEQKCASTPCGDYNVLGNIPDDILQTALEMYTYLVACPAKERV